MRNSGICFSYIVSPIVQLREFHTRVSVPENCPPLQRGVTEQVKKPTAQRTVYLAEVGCLFGQQEILLHLLFHFYACLSLRIHRNRNQSWFLGSHSITNTVKYFLFCFVCEYVIFHQCNGKCDKNSVFIILYFISLFFNLKLQTRFFLFSVNKKHPKILFELS